MDTSQGKATPKRRGGRRAISIEEFVSKFWGNVDKQGTGGCWLWRGKVGRGGYGLVRFRGRPTGVHRVSYILLVGDIPEGMTLDHLCRVRNCVNPKHLEPVSQQQNILRGEGLAAQNAKKTRCRNGHLLKPGNLVLNQLKRGKRLCLKCTRKRMAEWRRLR